jgi:UDP-2-acetamido-3-amino-2,3-dideoxy-glucuronate N-acetyltransferase
MRATSIHPTAVVEDAVEIGRGTQVWDNAHLRAGAVVGEDCIVGGKTYIAGDVRIGDRCKINANVYLCAGVSVGTGVMIAAHATFTNDIYPRACVNDLSELRPSEVDEHTTRTAVADGVTVGANAMVGLLEDAPADGAYPCLACDLVYGVADGRVVLDPLDHTDLRLAG